MDWSPKPNATTAVVFHLRYRYRGCLLLSFVVVVRIAVVDANVVVVTAVVFSLLGRTDVITLCGGSSHAQVSDIVSAQF